MEERELSFCNLAQGQTSYLLAHMLNPLSSKQTFLPASHRGGKRIIKQRKWHFSAQSGYEYVQCNLLLFISSRERTRNESKGRQKRVVKEKKRGKRVCLSIDLGQAVSGSWPLSFSFLHPWGRLIAHTSCWILSRNHGRGVCFHCWCCAVGVCLYLCVRGKTYRLFDTNNAGLLDFVHVCVKGVMDPCLNSAGSSRSLVRVITSVQNAGHTHMHTHGEGEMGCLKCLSLVPFVFSLPLLAARDFTVPSCLEYLCSGQGTRPC